MPSGVSGGGETDCNHCACGRHALVFAFFFLLALIFLLPGSLHWKTALLGYPGDNFQHAWFLWNFARSIAHAQNPFYTSLVYYPNRTNLAWSTTDPIASVLALPFSLLAGPIVAYNASLILQIALAGFFAYLLCLRVCRNFIASLIGGACFALSPFLMGEALGHLSLATAFPIPLYFLALDDLLARLGNPWKRGVALGAALFLTAMAHYNFTVFCALATLVVIAVDLGLNGRALAAKIWRPLATAAVTFALLFLPFFLAMWANPAARPRSRPLGMIEGHSADALGWLVPSWNHLLFGSFSRRWNSGLFTAGYEGIVYLGPVILLLAAMGLRAGRVSGRRWTIHALVTALVFWALSLGPHVRLWGRDTGIPGPGFLFYDSPFARFVSAPARFHIIVTLCLAILVSIGVAHLLAEPRTRAARAAITAALCAALALDLLTVPFPVSTSAESVRYPGFGVATAGCSMPPEVNGGTVITVPELEWPYPARAMWMQIQDGGRYALADGYLSYAPDSAWDEFWREPILRSIRQMQDSTAASSTLPAPDPAADRATLAPTLRNLNARAFVVFDSPRRDAVVSYLTAVLGREPQRQSTCTVFVPPAEP